MATMAKINRTMPVEDPFISPHASDTQRLRYSGFDGHQFSLHANGSPSQIKRALEAHLAETDRRLEDASQIGSVLVKQRQDLAERLREVDTATNGDEIPPELRAKVAELEREVAEISRETARIFVPKTRISSSETNSDTLGTSILSSHAQHSPSKVHAPVSRKARNQPQTRMNDVKLATALTDTLLNQMRELQAAYAEREEALKLANHHNSGLELDLDTLRQKMKALDDSEQRFKDENWSLETQVSDLLAAQKEAADREQRLILTLNASKSQHESVQREFEELKQVHSKLAEDSIVARKQHDSELGALRRNATTSEAEVGSLRKKIDDLTIQNKDLAKAFAVRLRDGERDVSQDYSFTQINQEDDQVTPENSPPPSPSKATPRHGALESETIKSSLHHAQRMIQHLKNNIHREKTEKFELKKLLQEARDDLESRRKGDSANKGKRISKQVEALKKTVRPGALGALRSSKDEILMDDPEWEDNDMPDTPSKSSIIFGTSKGALAGAQKATSRMPGAYADTATEASDAFETANENNTETEAFQTGVETLDGDSDSDQLTETEQATPRDNSRPKANVLNRYSFHSTASTSDDEHTSFALQTPLQKSQIRSKGSGESSRSKSLSPRTADGIFISESQSPLQDSPASFASGPGTPLQGKSLFAELGELSDGASEASGTPQSIGGSPRFSSPQIGRKSSVLPSRLRSMESHEEKPAMVDMGTSTDDPPTKDDSSHHSISAGAGLGIMGAMTGAGSSGIAHPISPEPETQRMLVTPQRLIASPVMSQATAPIILDPVVTMVTPYTPSIITSQGTVPIAASMPSIVSRPVIFSSSIISSQDTEPVAPARSLPIVATIPIPVALPEPEKVHHLTASTLVSQDTMPISRHTRLERTPIMSNESVPLPVVIKKSIPFVRQVMISQDTEPIKTAPVIVLPSAEPVETMKSVATSDQSTETEPIIITTPALELSNVISQDTMPQPDAKDIAVAGLPSIVKLHSSSSIISQETQPHTPTIATAVSDQAGAAAAGLGVGGLLGYLGRNKVKSESIVIAEDETSQDSSSNDVTLATSNVGDRQPFRAVDGNAQTIKSPAERPVNDAGAIAHTSGLNESTQTMLSANDIENLFKSHDTKSSMTRSAEPPLIISTSTSPRKSKEPRRPGSAGSNRSGTSPPPPLPAEAKQVIAAQRASMQPTTAGATVPGAMGPPIMPASAYKRASNVMRPTTPVGSRTTAKTSANAPISRSGMSSPVTRRSSISSFASELDDRFNIGNDAEHNTFGFNTDPRMLRALTETMLGEWLWKYTSGSGTDGASSNRHQRFFWVHPYTVTLYWSIERPQESTKKKGKVNSVSIISVRAVQDNNSSPPGLHTKSIVIETPHRTIKLTAPTAARHDTWFSALTYLLMRQSANDEDEDISLEDMADFDPNIRSDSRTTHRSRATVASYTSQTIRMQQPTLRARTRQGSQIRSQSAQPSSISSRLSAVFRTPQTFRGPRSSRQSQATTSVANSNGTTPAITPNETARNSTEHARQRTEAREREVYRMENVRACCDGMTVPNHLILSSSKFERPPRRLTLYL